MTDDVKNWIESLPEFNENETNDLTPFTKVDTQSYARDETITYDNRRGLVTGCWSSNLTGACRETRSYSIEQSSIQQNQAAPPCSSSGKAVTVITHF